ncbi:LamB/YcsF family protein [Pseudonocardia acaciae]|uniref:LamB/YcsF family protein n=1 Tax=Pseudonocardia acaciae TaxID=551276 RepID=UPI00048C9F82|nr:5-oxoprolinase subunit PxpA [Pseudonocardia acaciae]
MTSVEVALTTDIGEGFGRWVLADDDALLDVVTSANVACGFHAGDPDIMRRTCERAARNGVAVGAQVSYRDLAGFGRRYVAVPGETLANDLLYQIGALDAFARAAGTRVSYVRAHGALYNVAATNEEHAAAIVEAVRLWDPGLPVLAQVGTATWKHAERAGVRAIAEAFVDRAYTGDGLLLPRTHPEALLGDADEAAARAVRIVTDRELTAIDGETVTVDGRALLVHSDTPGALAIATRTRRALLDAGIRLVPLSELAP